MNRNYFRSPNLFVVLKISFVDICLLQFHRSSLKVIYLLNYVTLTHQLYIGNEKRTIEHFALFYQVNVLQEFSFILQLLKIVTILNLFCINFYLCSVAVCNYGTNKLLLFFYFCIKIIDI